MFTDVGSLFSSAFSFRALLFWATQATVNSFSASLIDIFSLRNFVTNGIGAQNVEIGENQFEKIVYVGLVSEIWRFAGYRVTQSSYAEPWDQ